ncbi:MAG: hypothetical protein QF473_39905 [Planctomycetota bacterium]|nr:hypothetical protein [Planctomycetota bacterium]
MSRNGLGDDGKRIRNAGGNFSASKLLLDQANFPGSASAFHADSG